MVKIALVCGDGLPVSGLLTVFRNVVTRFHGRPAPHEPVPADLGYSWRPDKPAFFPDGAGADCYPPWLRVSRARPCAGADLAGELLDVRRQVARADALGPGERARLHRRVEALAGPYRAYFSEWLHEHDVDWVVAVNMTLSDAVPVTLALHRAAEERWGGGRPGGVLFWDHDLFGSYAVHEGDERVYPPAPNEFTPLPGRHPAHRWAVVSEALRAEARGYPTPLEPVTVPNVLPEAPPEGLEDRHTEFLEQIGAAPDQPLLLVPVRVFRVKGVEISVRLFSRMRQVSREQGRPEPLLLVFGDLGEDPDYTKEVLDEASQEGVLDHVRFLDGVPLQSHRGTDLRWRLDEVDLLRVSAATGGGVLFTPNRPDVESVGLGPALATVAGLPSAVGDFHAFSDIYGDAFLCARLHRDGDLRRTAEEMLGLMRARVGGEPRFAEGMRRNRARMDSHFPVEPWRRLWEELVSGTEGAVPAPEDPAGA
ncbi:hypothetical protein OUQ99_19125 [Streptomonospora nanhaiensis]|uniref:Glycosyl transferase family 1 domain-containing protein n=1 Tax=Streptomonospora nanhaiensis TaxID=1323731 RepID=A0ABY6YGG7_9ACTN|nr:hypothetical protein [Streptomonospora nanhaiensis]WAE71342.1 hypothetical protein OUQ99_19125 [Streptomonospora nanhaiensis]